MGEERATRSDKKQDVKLTVHTEFKEAIYRLAFITDISVMDTVEVMLKHAIRSKRILEDISPAFIRDIKVDNVLYVGHINAEKYSDTPRANPNYVRVKTRLTKIDYNVLATLAYAMDVNPSRACAILINEAFHSNYFLDNYIKHHIERNMSDYKFLELKKIMEYAERNDNYNLNWASILSYVVREVSEPVTNIKKHIDTFVINHWRDK